MVLMTKSDLPLKLIGRGKVRDVYEVEGDRLLLVATDRPSALAAKAATTAIPIVFHSGEDPVRSGLVQSWASCYSSFPTSIETCSQRRNRS